MTLREAKKVARVAGKADGRCNCCVEGQAMHLQEVFPEFTWTYEETNYHPWIRVIPR